MARIDEKYVESLNNYSKSLEEIVEILQQQVKNKDTDVLETMLKNMDGEKIGRIVEDLKTINETTKRIESKTDKILQEIRSIKKQKESGLFGQVSDPKNKNKIVDGIKIITLIAGGVLAIGLAFKIIGKVDVLSVISLGISISIIMATFAYINEKIKQPDIKRTALIAGMMIIVSTAVAVSSWILMMSKPLSLSLALSITFTALAVGGALYLLSKTIEKTELKPKIIFGLMLLPFLAPVIAMAIMTSSYIFSMTKPISMKVASSVLFTSLALGIALYGVTKALSMMTWKGALMAMLGKGALLTILIGAVAGGIVLASWLFSKIVPISLMQGLTAIFVAVTLGVTMFLMGKVFKYVKGMKEEDAVTAGLVMLAIAGVIPIASYILSYTKVWTPNFALKLAITSLAIGVAILSFTPALWILKKANIKWEDIAKLGVLMVLISGIIVATSWILMGGKYDGNYPSWEWSLQVGLSLVVFGGEMAALGWVISKIGEKNLAYGAIAALAVSVIMVASSWLLSAGNYGTYPSLDWVTGVGLSLVIFGGAMIGLGFIIESTGGIGLGAMTLGSIGVLIVATSIMLSSWILSIGNYGKYPSFEWAKGVGLSLITFGTSVTLLGWMILASFGLGIVALLAGSVATMMVADTIVKTSRIISKGDYSKGPSPEWAAGTGLMIMTVGTSMMALGSFVLGTVGLGIVALLIGRAATLLVAETIVDVSKSLSRGSWSSGPSGDWAIGTGMLISQTKCS
jgi:hypothetical protein